MWIHISKRDNKLYQDGKEVKEIKLPNNIIVDIVERNLGAIWIKMGE